MNKKENDKKKRYGGLIVLGLTLLGALSEGDGIFVLIPLLVIGFMAAVVYVIVKAVQKSGTELPLPKKKKQENCDFGKANHEFSHDMQRRIAQLNEFRKNGLIDREEYAVLLRHYQEAEMRH